MDSSQTAEGLGEAIEPAGEVGPLVGEVVDVEAEAPRAGSLAWLELQEHVLVQGRELPACHRMPAGSALRSDAERGTRCALVRADGSTCGATGTRRYGLCIVHAGGGAQDHLREASRKGSAKLARLRMTRELLNIGPGAASNPRAVARVAAAARSEELALALLAPLDDPKLGSMDRQRAAVAILGETFPASTATIELDLPASPEAVASLGWQDLQALAGRVLGPDPDQTQ